MRLHKILLVFVLIIPVFSTYWYSGSSTYQIEKPWTYRSWRCNDSSDAYGIITCESKTVAVIDWPYVYYESCNCDESGCDTCPRCGRTVKTMTVGSLGYSRGAWNIDEFESSLDRLELDILATSSLDSDFVHDYEGYSLVINNLDSAYSYRLNAEDYADRCKSSSTYSAHTTGLVYSLGPGLYGNREITFNNYRAIMAPGGTRARSPCTAVEPSNPGGAYCKSYYVYWENTVSRALDALKFSFTRADYKIESQARPLWKSMGDSGICDDDYDWEIGDACGDMESAFGIIDGNVVEGTYGQYNSAKNYFKGLKKDVWKYPPDFSNYTRAMKLLWRMENGTIPLFTKLINDGNTALEDAEDVYGGFVSNASAYKSEVDSDYSEMESEKFSMIHESVGLSKPGVGTQSIGTIAERFSTFTESKLEAEELLSNATTMHSSTGTQGYLKTATRNAYDAKNIYEELSENSEGLLEDAETVVEQQRERTLSVLNQAKSLVDSNPSNTRAKSIYLQAKNLFDRGETESVLGYKFDYYVRAESYAWQALEEQGVLTNETEDLLLQVEDLLRRAEIDEINVEAEETMLSYLETEKESRDISGDLRSLIVGILEKADIKYGHLLNVREELLANISRSEACGDDFERTLQNAEKGIISGRTIDYMNGIGRLKSLEESYDEIAEELATCDSAIIANSLIITQSLYVERVKIDEPVDARLTILITNPTHYSGEDVSIDIPLKADMQLLYSDITEGQENVGNVLVDGNNLVLTLNSVGPYWTRSITFEKNAVFANTISQERNAVGIGDGKARVEETTIFSVDIDGVYLDLSMPEDSDVVSSDIDGKSTNSLLSMGEHTLSVVYTVGDAYELNKSDINAVPIGLNTQLNYKISVIPSIDIGTLPLTIDIEYGDVSGILISSLTGASITKEECSAGYCDIELSGLIEGEETLISVSYMILNTDESDASTPVIPESAHCIEGIGKECDPLPAGIEGTIAMINSANEIGDYATAIELKEKLKDELNKWWAEQRSLADRYEMLVALFENEKSEIESALNTTETANSSFTEDMRSRLTEIDSALSDADEATTVREAVSVLESLNPDWKTNIIKELQENAWNEYNSLKKRLFNAGVTAMPSEFLDVENKINTLAATESLEDAAKLSLSLAAAEDFVEEAEADVLDEAEKLRITFLDVKESITSILETYAGQQDAAEGTEWESLFTVDTSGLENTLGEIENMFGNEDNRLIKKKMEILEKKKEKVMEVLENLKDTSERMLQTARSSFETKKDALPYDIVTSVELELESMAAYIADENYIGALDAGKKLLADLGGYSESGESVNILLVILAVIAVLAAGGVYYYKFKKGGEETELPFFKKQKKEYRRLERAEQ